MTDRTAHEADFHARARASRDALMGRDEDVSRTWQRGTDADVFVPENCCGSCRQHEEVAGLRARLAAVEALADQYDANSNWREWGVGRSIRAALEAKP